MGLGDNILNLGFTSNYSFLHQHLDETRATESRGKQVQMYRAQWLLVARIFLEIVACGSVAALQAKLPRPADQKAVQAKPVRRRQEQARLI